MGYLTDRLGSDSDSAHLHLCGQITANFALLLLENRIHSSEVVGQSQMKKEIHNCRGINVKGKLIQDFCFPCATDCICRLVTTKSV